MTEQRTIEQIFFDGKDGDPTAANVVHYPDSGELIATARQDRATARQFRIAVERMYPDHTLKKVSPNGGGFWFVYGRKL